MAKRLKMKITQRIKNLTSRFFSGRAKLDSVKITDRNIEYYSGLQNTPADVTLDRGSRERAQMMCENEFVNDVVVYGSCVKINALTVGVGPILKITGVTKSYKTPNLEDLKEKCQYLEKKWDLFTKRIKLVDKLQLYSMSSIYHGEVFFRKVPTNYPGVPFDYVFIRPDRVGNPFEFVSDPCVYDGIRFDCSEDGAKPVCYYIRKEYINPNLNYYDYEEVSENEIIHIFDHILPQQHRGLPSMQSALPRIAQLKQLVSSTLTAMDNAAKLGVIFHTDNEMILSSTKIKPADKRFIDIPQGGMIAPLGYEPTVVDPKHPVAGFEYVKKIITADIGGTLGIGSGKVNNDHSPYNYSSAKMDEQIDNSIIEMRQAKMSRDFLDVVFDDWLTEISENDEVARELLYYSAVPELIERRWCFPEPKSLDVLKDAQADDVRLKNGTTTRAEIYAKRRKDSVEEIDQWINEQNQIIGLIND